MRKEERNNKREREREKKRGGWSKGKKESEGWVDLTWCFNETLPDSRLNWAKA